MFVQRRECLLLGMIGEFLGEGFGLGFGLGGLSL